MIGTPSRGRRRARSIAAVVLVLVAGAVPTSVLAAGPSPAAPPIVTIATTWDGGSPGSWGAYTAVVKNIGSAGFRGELFVAPAQDAAPPPAAGAMSHGSAPMGHGGAAPAPAPPRLVGAASHRSPLDLGPGVEKTVNVPFVVSGIFYGAEVRDQDGRLMAGAPGIALAASPRDQVGLLTDAVTGRAFLLSGASPALALSGRFRSARDFPADTALLRGLKAVVIVDFASASLSPQQLDALRGFLDLGGSLVLGGGGAWERTVGPLPDDLVPLRPSATATASLAPVADLAATSADATVTVATGTIVDGRSALQGPQGLPLVVEKAYGSGRIVQLTFDPLADVVAPTSRTLAVLARDYGLARAGVGNQQAVNAPAGTDGAVAILDAPRRQPAPRSPLVAGVVVYAMLVGPALFFVLHRRRASRMWLIAPCLALGLAGAAWLADQGPLQRQAVDHQLQVQRQAPGGTLQVDSWHRILPAGSGEAVLTAGPGVLAWLEPRPADQPLGLPPLVSPLVAGRAVGGDEGAGLVEGGGASRIELDRWPVWATRTVRTSGVVRQEPTLAAQLHLEGDEAVGSITNQGGITVRDLRVQAPDGRRGELGVTLEPGQTVEGRVTLVAPAPAPAPPDAAPDPTRALLDQAGRRPGARAGELDLIGLVPARPVLKLDGASLETRATAVLVTTVALEASDAVGAGFSRARQVCCGTGAPLVYEIDLPPGVTANLTVAAEPAVTSPPADSIEVYSSTAGRWRPLPGAVGLPGTASLEAGEFDGGIVRLRVQDAAAVKTLRVVSQPPGK